MPSALSDIPRVMPVMQSAFPPDFGEAWTASQLTALMMLPGSTLIVAEMDGRVVGFALSRCVLDECELLLLAVDPTVRRRGVGSAILQQVKQDAAAQGACHLMLEVRESNSQALALYGRAGFNEVGRRRNYYRTLDGLLLDALSMKAEIHS